MVAVGEKVQVHYSVSLEDGSLVDSSYGRGVPLEFTVGAGEVVPGFDSAVAGMEVGERRAVVLEPLEAYGAYREDLIEQVPCELMSNWQKMPIGERIVLSSQTGQVVEAVCLKIEDGIMHFDRNHPLAGKTLSFEIELLNVVRDEPEEDDECHCSDDGC